MSKKTYVEAIEFVLDAELDARGDLICLRPGARRALEEAERDVPLPRMGGASVSMALGAFLQGMHPVLDLRQESGAAQLLKEAILALPAGTEPVMTIIACAQDGLEELPGAYVFAPRTPRQAAGFMRSALKMKRLTLILADQALFAEEDEIPEDRGFTLLPLDEEAEALTEEKAAGEGEAAEGICAEAEAEGAGESLPEEGDPQQARERAEEAAYEEAEADPAPVVRIYAETPEKKAGSFPGMRQTACDLSQVRLLCAMLEMEAEDLIGRCAGHVLPVCGGFEMHYEADAPEGEAAFIPPEEEGASLWLGYDRLTVSYDPAQMAHDEAARLLRAVKRVLERPQLLIYDKEYDEA